MHKKVLIYSISLLLVLYISGGFLYSRKSIKHTNASKNKNNVSSNTNKQIPINNIQVELSEKKSSDDDLINRSDLIAEIKIIKLKEDIIKTIVCEPEETSEASNTAQKIIAEAPVKIYEAEIVDSLKNVNNNKEIEIIVSSFMVYDQTESFNPGNSYFVFLIKNNKFGKDSYNLTSFSQGTFSIDSNTHELKSFTISNKDSQINKTLNEMKNLVNQQIRFTNNN